MDVALNVNENRIRARADAFQAAIDGAPLDISLAILCRAVTMELPDARTAFYVADLDVTRLHPIHGADDARASYGGKWSFPIETADGKSVGAFALYLPEPRDVTAADRDLVDAITRAA